MSVKLQSGKVIHLPVAVPLSGSGERQQKRWTLGGGDQGKTPYKSSWRRGRALKPSLAGSEVSGRVNQCPAQGKTPFMLKAEPQKGLAIWFRYLLAD